MLLICFTGGTTTSITYDVKLLICFTGDTTTSTVNNVMLLIYLQEILLHLQLMMSPY